MSIRIIRIKKASMAQPDATLTHPMIGRHLLRKPSTAAALERCIALLLDNAYRPLDIREFG
jgi:hypothetical protein